MRNVLAIAIVVGVVLSGACASTSSSSSKSPDVKALDARFRDRGKEAKIRITTMTADRCGTLLEEAYARFDDDKPPPRVRDRGVGADLYGVAMGSDEIGIFYLSYLFLDQRAEPIAQIESMPPGWGIAFIAPHEIVVYMAPQSDPRCAWRFDTRDPFKTAVAPPPPK